MPLDPLGRNTPHGTLWEDHSNDRRARAIEAFVFVSHYRQRLIEARALIAANYPGNETRIDPDITQADIALRDAALELEASRLA